jgi:D-alanyl-D-alanine carboxypeptidase
MAFCDRSPILPLAVVIPAAVGLSCAGRTGATPGGPRRPIDVSSRLAEVERVALHELAETRCPGAAVLVISDGAVVFERGFGVASVETRAPVTSDMLFRVGSLTKMFTAAAILELAEEGRIRLDEGLGARVPLSPALANLTVHQLLSHTAGLTDDSPAERGSHDESALLTYVRKLGPEHVLIPADGLFSYSNPGYDIVGAAIENVSGRRYADEMGRRLFTPLQMRHTTFRPLTAMTYPMAQGHLAGQSGALELLRPMIDNTEGWPDGFLFSNVRDLSLFAAAFMKPGRILSAAVVAKMSTPHVPMPSRFHFDGGNYGYGLFIHDHRGVRLIWHAGIISGYGALLMMAPARRFAVIALTNRTGVLLYKTAERAMELFLPLRPDASAAPVSNGTQPEPNVNELVGTYRNPPEVVEVLAKGSQLSIRIDDEIIPATRVAARRYRFRRRSARESEEIVFFSAVDNRSALVHLDRRVFARTENPPNTRLPTSNDGPH